MQLRIRTITRLKSGGTSASDHQVEIDGNRIKVGRGTDNDVFLKDLRVSYRHADIVVRDLDVLIEAVGDSIVRVDEVQVDRAVLSAGSGVEVGPYRLQLLPAEPGADLVVAVELITPPVTDTVGQLLQDRRTRLEGGVLGRRWLSWALFLIVGLVTLALPVVAFLAGGSGPPRTPKTAATEAAAGSPFASFDRIWISGELSSSHKMLAKQCGVCHERAFVQVRKTACAACHQDVRHHFETARFEFAGFDATGCTGCHTEHVGPDGVVPAEQAVCADCHADLEATQPETTLLNATDFGTDHPEFRPSVVVDPGRQPRAGAEPLPAKIERLALGAQTFPKEMSNLRFPHDIHLAQVCRLKGENAIPAAQASEAERDACTILQMAQQRLAKGNGLACADCHQPEPGGVNMLPVSMRAHCADCHRLEFDPAAPGRLLPHGEPEEVIAVIDDFYAAELLRKGTPAAVQAAQATVQSLRQRPGGAAAGAPPAPVPQAAPDPMAEAVFVSKKKLEDVFGRQLCGVCHETVPPEASALGRWEVKDVHVAALWMPKARFDHAAHRTSACVDCHEARESGTSEDVLMPAIATCRECHLGEQAERALPSTCIMCHVYHRDDQEQMFETTEAMQAAHTEQ